MKVSVIWDHGEITTWQSANALKIALEWLYYNTAVLAVHCSTNNTLYLKSGRTTAARQYCVDIVAPTTHYI